MSKVFLIVLLLFPLLATSQIRVMMLDESTDEAYAPSEPSIAISKKNTDNIVAGAILDKVYVTNDGGDTWQTKKLESEFGVFGDPVILSDKKGRFHYLHLSKPPEDPERKLDRIVIQTSKDGGESWSSGASIGENHPKDQDKPQAYIDSKGNIYATWTQFDKYGSDNPEDESNILLSTSSSGSKWSYPLRLNRDAGDCLDGDGTVMGAVPVVALDGKIFVMWSYNEKIYLDRSFDGGRRWIKNEDFIMDQPGGWSFNIPGLSRANGLPSAEVVSNSGLVTNGRIYLLWSDQRSGENDTDIWLASSNNKGDSFSAPLRINDDGVGNHQFFPALSVDQSSGIVYVLYYDRRINDGLKTEVYIAYSEDGGKTFNNRLLSEKPFELPQSGVFLGDYIDISSHEGKVAAVWTEYNSGKTQIKSAVFDHEDLMK